MTVSNLFPAGLWLAKTNAQSLRSDAFAGFTNAAIVLPQGVAFAAIAGLPPQYGLYTAMVTAVIAALFGSSMVMISGPTTALSAVMFATLSQVAAPGTATYIELALMLTVLVGLFQMVGGIANLGGLVSFVSHSVMTAFTAAAAVLIAVSQLSGALGVHVERGGNALERILRVTEHFWEVNPLALGIGATTLAVAIVMQKLAPRLPGLLIALCAGIGMGELLDAGANGVDMVGTLPSMIPSVHVPGATVSDVVQLAPGALAIALIGLLEAISIGRSFAVRRKEAFDANQEMIGQGLSNVVGGFFQCYAGSGSFTRSGVNATAGAVTPLSGIFASAFLAIILLFVSPLVAKIPTPALSGLILLVAWKLIDFKELRHIIESRSPETIILVLTLLVGLMVELDFAIYIGVIASLCVFIYESSKPQVVINAPVITPDGRRKFRDVTLFRQDQCPQLVSLSLEGPLYFGSVERVERKFKEIRAARSSKIHIILVLKGLVKVDLAGADLLIETIRDVRASGGTFRVVSQFDPLIASLKRFHVIDELGEDHLHPSKSEALTAAMEDFSIRKCKACLFDVFEECDALRAREV